MTECPFCKTTHQLGAVPTVHLNGTAAQDLFDGLQAAIEAVREAQHKLCLAAPNGRDYYTQSGNGIAVALERHERRWTELSRILTELEEQRDHVLAVMDFEAERRASK